MKGRAGEAIAGRFYCCRAIERVGDFRALSVQLINGHDLSHLSLYSIGRGKAQCNGTRIHMWLRVSDAPCRGASWQ